MSNRSLMILIAGPYRSGTGDDPELIARNLRGHHLVASGNVKELLRPHERVVRVTFQAACPAPIS